MTETIFNFASPNTGSYTIFLPGEPIAKARHRWSLRGRKPVTYDPQKAENVKMKFVAANLFRSQGLLNPLEGPIKAKVVCLYPKPKIAALKTLKTLFWKVTRKDCDNLAKAYGDILNGIAYKDDSQITSLFARKVFHDKEKSGVEIIIQPLRRSLVVREHGLKIKDTCSYQDIKYLVNKVIRYQKSGREISNFYCTEDEEGTDFWFEVEEMVSKK